MAHWPRRTALLLAAVLGAAALGISPAQAGGPTSVLLSAPDVPKVVAAGYSDKQYEQLQELVAGKPEARTAGDGRESGRFIRATWLIHDMVVWRLDLIYPDAPGGPWIATTEDRDGSGKMPDEPVWHRATDGAALSKLLYSLGLLDKTDGFSAGGPTSLPSRATETPAPLAADDQPLSTAPTTLKADQKALSGWRWSIPGFLLGAVIMYLAARLIPRRRPWELIDEEEPAHSH